MTRPSHLLLILLILPFAPHPVLAEPIPLAPGSLGLAAPIVERCPLFTWQPAEAGIQELLLFTVPEESDLPLDTREPDLRVQLPVGLDKYRLQAHHALEPSGDYAWTIAGASSRGSSWRFETALRFEVLETAPPCDRDTSEPTDSIDGLETLAHPGSGGISFSTETSGGTERGEMALRHSDPFGVKILATPYGGVISHLDASAGFEVSSGMLLLSEDLVSLGAGKRLSVGNTGINTGNALYVERWVSGAASPDNHVARIRNDSTLGSADVLALQIEEEGSGPDSEIGAANNFVTFLDKDGESLGSIQGDGSGGVTLAGPGNDYAEWLPRLSPEERIEAGALVGIHGGKVALATEGADAVMVVSPGPLVAGGDPGEEQRHLYERIAFVGQVDVAVEGPVARGDLVVPSGRDDGTAIAFAPDRLPLDQLHQVVGQAWSNKDEPAIGPVRVVVGLFRPAAVAKVVERISDRMEQRLERRIASLTAELTARFAELEKTAAQAAGDHREPEASSP